MREKCTTRLGWDSTKSQIHNKHILRSNMSAKCTMREGMIALLLSVGLAPR